MKHLLLLLALLTCSPSCKQNAKNEQETKSLPVPSKITPSKSLAQKKPDPQALIKELEKKINNYKKEVSTYQNYLDMKMELHMLNDSINKLSYGSGLDVENLFQLKFLLYNKGICNNIYPLILENSLSDQLTKELLPTMIRILGGQGNFEQLINLDSIYIVKYEEYETPYFTETVTKVKEIKKLLDSLDGTSLNTDQLLWEKGIMMFERFRTSWNESEVGYDMSLSFSYFNELIKYYPKSDYTDNAILAILKYEEGLSHEGGDQSYNFTAINKYREFLNKHPTTEDKDWINLRIAKLLYVAEVQREQRLNTVLASCDQLDFVQKYYPNYEPEEVDFLKRKILKAITELGWDFSIWVPKDSVSLNGEINVTYKLKNITDSIKSIAIDSENPNFRTFILSPKGVKAEFVKIKFPNSKNEIISVFPDSTYLETWNLKNKAYYNGYLGTYKFSGPGIYKIKASKRETEIHTEYLEIYLENSP